MPLPLVTLQPLVNPRHRWVGLLLRSPASDAGNLREVLGALFDTERLADDLAQAVFVLDAAAAVDLLDDLAPRGVLACVDEASLAAHPLAGNAAGVLLRGLPAAGAPLPAAACGVAVSGDVGSASLARLPGSHLALELDTQEQFDAARHAGFHWLAGRYALHAGEPGPGAGNGHLQTTVIKLLAQVTSDADTREIEATLKRDPQLSFQLLKLVNSVAFSTQKHISSFTQAIAILGRRQLQRWLQLLLYAQPRRAEEEASPLLPRAAQRAALMEALALAAGGGHDDQEQAFMAGMFSLLHILFGQPLERVIAPLNLPETLAVALTHRSGRFGAWLNAIEAAEGADMAAMAAAVADAGLDAGHWCHAQVVAARWALQVSAS